MDCGIPFCHKGCPLGNEIPDFNDHVYRGRWDLALASLEATNNFPEVTGRVCPAPCEASCVLGLSGAPVTIKEVERAIGARMLDSALVAQKPARRRGQSIAIVGSGPAGLACAQQLARRGFDVTVFERDDRLGGLLRYGIPDFKMEKGILDLRIDQMEREGVRFRVGAEVGKTIGGEELRARFDAVVLAIGAGKARALDVPGADLLGIVPAMTFLTQQNRRVAGDPEIAADALLANGKHVVILGGGDTGSDCVGTALRQHAASVTSLELLPAPPSERAPENPWPEWPLVLRTSSSHEEGGVREFAERTTRVLGDDAGRVRALSVVEVEMASGKLVDRPGTEREIPCDLLLLAMGFVGVDAPALCLTLGLDLSPRGTIPVVNGATRVPGVFAAGDAVRGASLVVWAIAEGRRVADSVETYLGRLAGELRELG
jgi:glutamate synthase (NADPH/NADH) small chain